jgi:MoaA/NifB/PqqE/SkfB family radical SAM enzyme
MHSHLAEVEDRITRCPGALADKRLGIRHAQEALAARYPGRTDLDLPLHVNVVMNRLNVALLPNTVEAVVELGVGRVNLYFPRIAGNAARDFDEVVPSMREAGAAAAEAVRRGEARRARVTICDLPPCVLPGREDALGPRLAKLVVRAARGAGLVGGPQDVRGEKVKRPECRACRHDAACEGVFAGYVARRGWDELTPVPA